MIYYLNNSKKMNSHNLRRQAAVDWKKLCYGKPLPRMQKTKVENRVVLEETYEIEGRIARKTSKTVSASFNPGLSIVLRTIIVDTLYYRRLHTLGLFQ